MIGLNIFRFTALNVLFVSVLWYMFLGKHECSESRASEIIVYGRVYPSCLSIAVRSAALG